jgi:hypothetical protein
MGSNSNTACYKHLLRGEGINQSSGKCSQHCFKTPWKCERALGNITQYLPLSSCPCLVSWSFCLSARPQQQTHGDHEQTSKVFCLYRPVASDFLFHTLQSFLLPELLSASSQFSVMCASEGTAIPHDRKLEQLQLLPDQFPSPTLLCPVLFPSECLKPIFYNLALLIFIDCNAGTNYPITR